MPDPIQSGCNRMPPIHISGKPPVNSHEEIVIYGCVPKGAKPAALTEAQAKTEVLKRCRQLKLSSSATGELLKSCKITGLGNTPAGADAKGAIQMLKTLAGAVKANPKITSLERDQFAVIWSKLGKRAGARQAWTQLGAEKHFWGRLSAKNRRTVAYHLAHNKIGTATVATAVKKIMGHHLFAAANHVGKHNALADLCDSAKLLNANTLPDKATMKKQASALMKKHLGHMKPASRAIFHQQVMAKANFLQKSFFEYKAGSGSKKLWGDRFVNAFGRDWYQQCANMILSHGMRSACRSAFQLLGAHKGADTVCGKD